MKTQIITKENKAYPNHFRMYQDMPEKIYVLGDETLLNKKSIAIVGSRKCSEYGWKTSNQLAKEIAQNKIGVVSGMAVGIDGAAHLGAMKEVGKTIAVLGGGFKHIYPKENESLFYDILKNGGCVISEYEETEYANTANFPKRNRLISALAIGVLVIEAKYRSGSTITARYAKKQKKEVFCVPGLIDTAYGYGTNHLIQKGAKLVTSSKDILSYYGIEPKVAKSKAQENEGIKNKEIKKREILRKETVCIQAIEKVPKSYQVIYKIINQEPVHINDIARKLKKNIREVNEAITILEMEGLIQNIGSNFYVRCEVS